VSTVLVLFSLLLPVLFLLLLSLRKGKKKKKEVWGIEKRLIPLIQEILYAFIYNQRESVNENNSRVKNR